MATIIPELKSLHSPDLPHDQEPVDPADAAGLFEASIGAKGQEDAEVFSFVAITPRALAGVVPLSVESRRGFWVTFYATLTFLSRASTPTVASRAASRCG